MKELINVTTDGDCWWTDNCYETIWLDHDIDENSTVIEFGGYKGNWVSKMSQKYNSNIYVFEPIPEFFKQLDSMFLKNEKINVYNFGVSLVTGKNLIYVSNDSTSVLKNVHYPVSDTSLEVDFLSVDEILDMTGEVDLCQMNIEGSEYDLLDYLISSGKILMIKRLMIEFHYERDDVFVSRRHEIQKGLIESGYKCVWNYEWVFEYWILE
jgi:FkbM family methyltransferase